MQLRSRHPELTRAFNCSLRSCNGNMDKIYIFQVNIEVYVVATCD